MIYPANLSKQESLSMATNFLQTMFYSSINQKAGEIEIRIFRPQAASHFFSSVQAAAELTIDLCNQGLDVYVGVNPRTGQKGKKENVHYLSSFHAEIDYGSIGHKKETEFANYEEAMDRINNFHLQPSAAIHSGGGFHCYWVLKTPLRVSDYGIATLENINKALTQSLNGDPGTHDISRVLRVPGTFNFKKPENPRPVEIISISGLTYEYDDFGEVLATIKDEPIKAKSKPEKEIVPSGDMPAPMVSTPEIIKPTYADAYQNRASNYFILGNKEMGCRDTQKMCELGNCKTLEVAKRKGYCR